MTLDPRKFPVTSPGRIRNFFCLWWYFRFIIGGSRTGVHNAGRRMKER